MSMITGLHHVTVVAPDYDEALGYYTEVLGFEKLADDAFGQGEQAMRWVVVAPKGQTTPAIVLSKASDPDTQKKIGKLVGWVFHTDDCKATYETLRKRGVKFTEAPTDLMWGVQATFEDLYGNQFVLLQPSGM